MKRNHSAALGAIATDRTERGLQLARDTESAEIMRITRDVTAALIEGQQRYERLRATSEVRAKLVKGEYLKLADEHIRDILAEVGRK